MTHQTEEEPCMTFTAETEFAVKNIGYGLVTYEKASDFLEYRDGRMYTKLFDREGLVWSGGHWQTPPSYLGLRCVIVRREDMTPEQIAEAWGE